MNSDDEIFDEIDEFHATRDELSDDDRHVFRRKKKVEEVLNVEGDISESETDDDNDGDESDFDSDDENNENDAESVVISAGRWGRKREGFYNTSYVDGDWGGMNEDDEEIAELEEQDATFRQKKLDAALSTVNWEIQDTDGQKDTLQTEMNTPLAIEKMTQQQKLEYFLKVNPELEKILQEYSQKREVMHKQLVPLLNAVKSLHSKKLSVLEKAIILCVSIFSSYLINILFYIRTKVTAKLEDIGKKKYLDNHPVLDSIIQGKGMILKAENFLENNKKTLKHFVETAGKGFKVTCNFDSKRATEKLNLNKINAASELRLLPESNENSQDTVVEEQSNIQGLKRGINYQIEKNKGLLTKRKKGTQHSRVKKRKQFAKAMIKKRSQRPDVRREITPYGGERRGIRISTVKSIKLNA